MKKVLFCLFALSIMGESAKAQKIAVADVEAIPGETVELSLSLSEGKADTYTALTFDVCFPENGFSTTGGYDIADSWQGATAVVGAVDETGVATIPIASSEALPGSEVEDLVKVSFKVGENASTGNYQVSIKNAVFEYGMSEKDVAANVTFMVNVVSVHTVVLDEQSDKAPVSASNVNVRVNRTITAGVWNTICLPFAMSEAQVKAAFGDDVKLGDFTGWTPEYDNDDNVIGIAVAFAEVSAIEKNHPYIIKRPTATTALTEFTADGVYISPDDEPFKSVGKKSQGTFGSFTGTYVAGTAIDEKCLFLNDNKFWYSTGNTTMNAFRAYFYFQDVIASYSAGGSARMRIAFNDEVTEVKDVKQVGAKDGRIYNLQGQQVEQPGKGLYIKDGKVFMNK